MAFFIAALTHALVPLALAIALLPAIRAGREPGTRAGASSLLAVLAGMAVGFTAMVIAAARASETATSTALSATVVVLSAAVLVLLVLLHGVRSTSRSAGQRRPRSRTEHVFGLGLGVVGPVLLAVLAAEGLYGSWLRGSERSLTATDVVNTELIVNCAAIVVGLAALVALAWIAGPVARLAGATAATLVLGSVLALETLTGSAEVMLGLLRLDMMSVTSARVAYVAKVSLVEEWAVYVELALVLALCAVAFRRRFRAAAPGAGAPPIARVRHRKERGRALHEFRWRAALSALSAGLLVVLAYQDLYASLPPSLSPAAPVTPDAAGDIRIPIDEVKDGTLHRYAYIASDGHQVRFFLINRYDEEHVRMGVVFDACMICGDDGYVQRGEEIICIACNVRIFRPSIGKPGGCNPIPIPHDANDGAIRIAARDLEKGARYFSEVVKMEVADPVTGEALINLTAPYQYQYGGRTYFFGTRQSYDTFRNDPEAYTRDTEARYLRIQGHHSTGG